LSPLDTSAKKTPSIKSKKIKPQFELEKIDWKIYEPAPVIGVDEVGRGCLAGPVYAGAAILQSDIGVYRLTDSKLLSESDREEIAAEILANHQVSIAFATEDEIEKLNIFKASLLAMKRAVEALMINSPVRGHCLVDGKFIIPGLVGFSQTALIKGDLRAAPISAAAICAKVSRDRWMKELDEKFPEYGFRNHKGYATPEHKEAIRKFGPKSFHRKSFAGVREYL
jgi:ribonuclease HII